MQKIIISYRRKDSDAIAGRIRDRVTQHFGDKAVFMDIDSIPLGLDFRKQIQEALRENQLLLAVVGPNWIGPVEGGPARILDESDPVRIEVETALQRGIPTIPVLVGGAKMPKASELPESLKDFPFFNAAEVSAGIDFNQHIDRLIRAMEQILKRESSLDHIRTVMPTRRTWFIAAGAVAAGIVVVIGLLFAFRESIFGTGPHPNSPTAQITPPQPAPFNPPPQIVQQPTPVGVAPQPSQSPAPAQTTPAAQAPMSLEAKSAAAACEPGSVPIFYDNFKVVDPAWDDLGTDPRMGFYLADGQLVMAAQPDDDIYFYRMSMLRNASICAHVISPPAMKDPFGTGAGIAFWASSEKDYYDALIFPGGGYMIEKWVKGSSTNLAKEKTDAVKSGPNAVNEIKLTNKSNGNTLTINGHKAQDFKGQPGKDDGHLGFIAVSESTQLDEWRFSDIVMTQPNYADEFTDFGVPPQSVLQEEVGRTTPTTLPGAHVIATSDLYAAIQRGTLDGAPFLLVDVLNSVHPKTIRGAKRVPQGGSSGNFDDDTQQHMLAQLNALTKSNLTIPIVFFCEGAKCWESYNAALRAEKMGFTRVYWYRGGLNAWKEAGLPMN